MKLRIKDNSLRLRLTQSEVKRLANHGSVESETDFGQHSLRYAVISSRGESALRASFELNAMIVHAPESAVIHWAEGEEVGLYGEQPTSKGAVLSIAVEKDFRCLEPRRDQDESDNFDNPLASQSRDATWGECPPRK